MSLILLVEDFEPMRVSTAAVLRQLGYEVLEAESAESAMSILTRESVDVLFADVALPGTSGDVFAAEACSLRQGLKVVFGTGLTQFPPSRTWDGPPVLRKPYTAKELVSALGSAAELSSGA